MPRETAAAQAKRYKAALKGIAALPDGVPIWTAKEYAGSVLNGDTFAEAVAAEEEQWAATHSEAADPITPARLRRG